MDRLNELRGEAGTSGDSTLDTSSPPSEAFTTANESSSKYFSLSEVDSTFDISPIKDVSLGTSAISPDREEPPVGDQDRLISNLSPIGKKNDFLDSYKIGKQIEAANILSGGVEIFDHNENSYDGDELVIDDNVECDEKGSSEKVDSEFRDDQEALGDLESVPSKDTEVILQIDGKNVDAIDIGNGLYLYRKEGEEELAAVQIDEDQQQPSFKFLKVRENLEGNLEVYEEFQIEVPKEVPIKEKKCSVKSVSNVPVKDLNKVISDVTSNKIVEVKHKSLNENLSPVTKSDKESSKDSSESKSENGKLMKFSEMRKSPVVGSFTPMTYHSTPNKEGIPLTKTMVDLQLHPNRHSDNVKKTIEVHTDNLKPKLEMQSKNFKEQTEESRSLNDEKSELNAPSVISKTIENSITMTDSENPIDDKTVSVDKNEVSPSLMKNENDKTVSVDEKEVSPSVKKSSEDKPIENKIQNDLALNIIQSESHLNTGKTEVDVKEVVKKNEVDTLQEDVYPHKNESSANSKLADIESDIKVLTSESGSTFEESKIEMIKVECSTSTKIPTVIDKDKKDNIDESLQENLEDCLLKSDSNKEQVLENINSNKEIRQCQKIEAQNHLEKVHVAENVSTDIKQDKLLVESVSTDIKKDKPLSNSQPGNVKSKTFELKQNATEAKSDISIKPISYAGDEKKIKELDTPQNLPSDNSASLQGDSNPDILKSVDAPSADSTQKSGHKTFTADVNKGLEISSKSPNSANNAANNVKIDKKISDAKAEVKLENKTVDSKSLNDNIELTKKNNVTGKIINVTMPLIKKDAIHKISLNQVDHMSSLSPIINKRETTDNKTIDITNTVKTVDSSEKIATELSTKPLTAKDETDTHIKTPDVATKIESTESKPQERISHSNIPGKSESNVTVSQKPNDPIKEATATAKAIDISTKSTRKLEVLSDSSVVKHVEEEQETKFEDTESKPEPIILQNNETSSSELAVTNAPILVTKVTSNTQPSVPFGKWTEVNRQAFLNKIKVTKAPPHNSNGKQIKNSNDLNRRDVLKKIDSQRQNQSNVTLTKVQDFGSVSRLPLKKESSVFSTRPDSQEVELMTKTETSLSKNSDLIPCKSAKEKISETRPQINSAALTNVNKKEHVQRKEINNQDLIDKTIEDIINRAVPVKSQDSEEPQSTEKEQLKPDIRHEIQKKGKEVPKGLDEIEMKMNELHGIPFIERPPHQLPPAHNPTIKTYSKHEPQTVPSNKISRIPNLVSFNNKQKNVKENIIDVDSDEEIIEHEPITGDMDISKQGNVRLVGKKSGMKPNIDKTKKEVIITEKDFDKFVRRNSISYESSITVNLEKKEPQIVQQKDARPKTHSKTEILSPEGKITIARKPDAHKQNTSAKQVNEPKKCEISVSDDSIINKQYQSKVKMAYETVMTAKRKLECPILEDKPVKVVYMNNATEFIPKQLNVQGKELSPPKRQRHTDNITSQTNDSIDSEIFDVHQGRQDDSKMKSKHQRKQVLTPVEAPEFEVIEPEDLGIVISPKKKRKTEDKTEKSSKAIVPKKSYLLGRAMAMTDEPQSQSYELPKTYEKETSQSNSNALHNYTASAIDNLVKAAELLETQSESVVHATSDNQDLEIRKTTPIKRGRGRPRKYPAPEIPENKTQVTVPSKQTRLSETKTPNRSRIISDTDDEIDDDNIDSSDSEMIKENWTMGKINENILCPICNKLFRSENVVFKHVKHCTGPSPNRSESDNRSPRRLRVSDDSEPKSDERKSVDINMEENENIVKDIRNKRRSRDVNPKSSIDKSEKAEIIVIEDTPIKQKIEKKEVPKNIETRKSTLNKNQSSNLVCEFCGKTFRQLSYLVNHKLQHEKEVLKKAETKVYDNKSVFSCEICKKDFRKLHHLVQHRIIHNPGAATTAKILRKNSSESNDKVTKEQKTNKPNVDASAAFRCEPCDKSFRKLHHLVEHRETHDGINRQKSTSAVQPVVEKTTISIPQCEICKKTFRKLHHLIEHKEQHLETVSEKSDDKSIKSSLSTKDIIHECPLCYMVFPNEHSLNKHSVFCQRKKRQSANKQKPTDEPDVNQEDMVSSKTENDVEIPVNSSVILLTEDDPEIKKDNITKESKVENTKESNTITTESLIDLCTESPKPIEVKPKDKSSEEVSKSETDKESQDKPENIKPSEDNDTIKDKQKKKTPQREKSEKNKKPIKANPSVKKKKVETNDDDDVRYMLNPDYGVDDNNEEKTFLKIRACKRNSLQIERPNSKDLIKRRISLQNPPRVPRLKAKLVQIKSAPTNASSSVKSLAKSTKQESVPSTDSDDSDVKYSFPKTVVEKVTKKNVENTATKETAKKIPRKSIAAKRKSLSSIAKRKSLGKTTSSVLKEAFSSVNPVKRGRTVVEHRCDCGQLFNSAALLSRHASVSHTPPRRRRPSPAPTITPPTTQTKLPKTDLKRSSDKANPPKTVARATKHRQAAHKGVPLPEKMRKLMEKSKK